MTRGARPGGQIVPCPGRRARNLLVSRGFGHWPCSCPLRTHFLRGARTRADRPRHGVLLSASRRGDGTRPQSRIALSAAGASHARDHRPHGVAGTRARPGGRCRRSAVRPPDRHQPHHFQRRVLRPGHDRGPAARHPARPVSAGADRPRACPRGAQSDPRPARAGRRQRPRAARRRYIPFVVRPLRALPALPAAAAGAARPPRRPGGGEPAGRRRAHPILRGRLGDHSERRGHRLLPDGCVPRPRGRRPGAAVPRAPRPQKRARYGAHGDAADCGVPAGCPPDRGGRWTVAAGVRAARPAAGGPGGIRRAA